jgi:NitT/TauT family transport system substrate-binding protein
VNQIKKNQLNIGHLSTAYHTNFILMGDDNFQKDMGKTINWTLFGTGPAMMKAFEKGELDIGYMGVPPAIVGIDRGAPIKCVAGGHVEGTIAVAKKKYKTDLQWNNNLSDVFSQFKGKIIGTPSKGSIHDVILNHFLDKFNMQDDIEVKNYKQAEMIALDIKKDKIQCGVGTPALAVFTSTMFESHLVIHPDNFWLNNPSYGIFFHNDIINNDPELVEKFLIQHKKAATFLREFPKKAAEKIVKKIKIATEKYIFDVLKISPKYCIALPDGYLESTKEFIQTLHDLNYIKNKVQIEDIFDFQFIHKIHPESHHYLLT